MKKPTHVENLHRVFRKNLGLLLGRRYTGLRTRLADHLGVAPYMITRLLNGDAALPCPATLDRIAFFFALPTNALFQPNLEETLTSPLHSLRSELMRELVNMSDEEAIAAMSRVLAVIKQMRQEAANPKSLPTSYPDPARLRVPGPRRLGLGPSLAACL